MYDLDYMVDFLNELNNSFQDQTQPQYPGDTFTIPSNTGTWFDDLINFTDGFAGDFLARGHDMDNDGDVDISDASLMWRQLTDQAEEDNRVNPNLADGISSELGGQQTNFIGSLGDLFDWFQGDDNNPQ